ncbi:MAG: acyltransferase [Clostridiales bacterium]|nr:acyltransferase [Candidatus Cacconaster stercorequi]
MEDTKREAFSLGLLTENRQELYGVATLWIIVFHSYLCNVYFPTIVGRLITYGNMGCEIFLFLSGICLYFSYHGDERTIPFLKRRLVRLYVPMVLICTGYWLFELFRGGVTVGALGRLAANYLTLSLWLTGDNQIWFVSLLMLAYFLYPYVYHALFDGAHKGRTLLLLLLLAVGVTVLIQASDPDFYNATAVALTRLPVFLVGCFLGRRVYDRHPLPPWVIPVCAAVFCTVIVVLEWDVLHGMWRRYFYLPGGIALTVVLAWLFHAVQWRPLHTVFRFLGNMSLELYLLNIILIRLYRLLPCYDPDTPSAAGYLLLLVVNIALAYGFFRLGKRLTPRVQKWFLDTK